MSLTAGPAKRLMGFEPTTFCMASSADENDPGRLRTTNPASRHGFRASCGPNHASLCGRPAGTFGPELGHGTKPSRSGASPSLHAAPITEQVQPGCPGGIGSSPMTASSEKRSLHRAHSRTSTVTAPWRTTRTEEAARTRPTAPSALSDERVRRVGRLVPCAIG